MKKSIGKDRLIMFLEMVEFSDKAEPFLDGSAFCWIEWGIKRIISVKRKKTWAKISKISIFGIDEVVSFGYNETGKFADKSAVFQAFHVKEKLIR